MSSYADIKIDGMTIIETQNYYHDWYFRKSERVIEEIEAKQYFDELIYAPNKKVKSYKYKTNASTIRRRLELDGHDRASLELEFKTQLKQLTKDLDDMLLLSPDRVSNYIETVRNSKLEDWLSCLSAIKNKRKKIPIDTDSNHNKTLMDFMLGVDLYFSERPGAGDFHFPCLSEEGYAVAILEISPDSADCILDVTALVLGGWTEDFGDIIEFQQENTTFYEVYSTSIDDIKKLIELSPENIVLARLLYAAVITAMETYLSDTFKKQILNREAIRRRFIKNNDHFKNKKITLSDIYENIESINEEIIKKINEMSFHNIQKIPSLYKSVLNTEFPEHLISELISAIDIRHDIVHRNGKSVNSKKINITMRNVENLIKLIDLTIQHIDKQIKDGLLDDLDPEEL